MLHIVSRALLEIRKKHKLQKSHLCDSLIPKYQNMLAILYKRIRKGSSLMQK